MARNFVILNGPIYRPETVWAEERLAQFFLNAFSWDHPYLREHLNLGLPKTELIENLLRERGLSFVRIPNGNLTSWLGMMAMKHFVMMSPASERSGEIMDRAYNILVSPRDFGGLCYREAYVVAKDKRGANALGRVEAAFRPRLTAPPDSRNLDRRARSEPWALEGLLELLSDQAQAIRQALKDQRDTIQALQGTISDLQTAVEDQRTIVAERESALAGNCTLALSS